MKGFWDEEAVRPFKEDLLKLRVYSSRLLGGQSDLVLHGGGNTSVKLAGTTLFGETEPILMIKGSGHDLATIGADGFATLRLDWLRRALTLERLADDDLLVFQSQAMVNPAGPIPSVEALLHAAIDQRFVDHTHADAVVTLTNTPAAPQLIADVYGQRVLFVPYVHPGFELAKTVMALAAGRWDVLEGIVLQHHGLVTFADEAKTSYQRMIDLVTRAEAYLQKAGFPGRLARSAARQDLHGLARLRRLVSLQRGQPVIARWDDSPEACGFADRPGAGDLLKRGPLTADHVVRTKPFAAVIDADPQDCLAAFAQAYGRYFERFSDGSQVCQDPAPRWALWPGHGTVAFGDSLGQASQIADIVRHTLAAVQAAEALGGWQSLDQNQVFAMEYWPPQLAKTAREQRRGEFAGQIALVTGAASGIGLACARRLLEHGAAVVGLDINDAVKRLDNQPAWLGLACDVTDPDGVAKALAEVVRHFGGLDILVSNAGFFPVSQKLDGIDPNHWQRSRALNLTSHQRLLAAAIPYLKEGVRPAVVVLGSKNVPAPGPGAAAYSVAKAGLTQLARLAALELGPLGIRVNIVHPDAVYDTALWTPQLLASRAAHYGLSVEQYKTKNLLKTEVTSADVAALVCAMAGRAFAKTTGAQVPIDGGNERVI